MYNASSKNSKASPEKEAKANAKANAKAKAKAKAKAEAKADYRCTFFQRKKQGVQSKLGSN